MNITTQIAEQIGGDIEILIKDNPQIQFYANSNIDAYQWIDSRFEDTSDVWKNKILETRQELISEFKRHLETKSRHKL
jgi:hypothetical protein